MNYELCPMNYKIVLASNSPRRRELLSGLGFDYEVRTLKDLDESYPKGLPMEEIPQYISRKKAEAYTIGPDELLITADTIVYLDGEVLGKPTDEADAIRMLRKLSGRTHQVVTGVTLKVSPKSSLEGKNFTRLPSPSGEGVGVMLHSFASVSQVTFADLTEEEIRHYVTLGQGRSLRHTGVDWLHRRHFPARVLLQCDGAARAKALYGNEKTQSHLTQNE